MSALAAPMDECERLRLLALMGVDVYVPRNTPLARANPLGAAHARDTPSSNDGRAPVTPVGARLIVGGVGRDEHPQLLAAVLRGARLRAGEWTLGTGAGGGLPVWRFGASTGGENASAAMTFPPLAELRDSVVARRNTWYQLRAWLRGP